MHSKSIQSVGEQEVPKQSGVVSNQSRVEVRVERLIIKVTKKLKAKV